MKRKWLAAIHLFNRYIAAMTTMHQCHKTTNKCQIDKPLPMKLNIKTLQLSQTSWGLSPHCYFFFQIFIGHYTVLSNGNGSPVENSINKHTAYKFYVHQAEHFIELTLSNRWQCTHTYTSSFHSFPSLHSRYSIYMCFNR